jgi:hypothetical protein
METVKNQTLKAQTRDLTLKVEKEMMTNQIWEMDLTLLAQNFLLFRN